MAATPFQAIRNDKKGDIHKDKQRECDELLNEDVYGMRSQQVQQ